MNNIHQTGVLKSYINFQLLDYLKEKYEEDNNSAGELVNCFAKDRKKMNASVVLSCISCKETTLSLLAGMIFFVRSKNLPPIQNDKYKWWEEIKPTEHNDDDPRCWAIAVIRNAIAHCDEGESGVEFLDSKTKFNSKAGTLTLSDEKLHELIMQMYGYAQKA